MNYSNSSNIAYNPYSAINPHNLSDAALCYKGNPIQDCVHFTPNSNINQMPSGVFHGQNGPGVRSIQSANPSEKFYMALDIDSEFPGSMMLNADGNMLSSTNYPSKGCQSKKKKFNEPYEGCLNWSQQGPIDFDKTPIGCSANFDCPGTTRCESNRCIGKRITKPVRPQRLSGGSQEHYKSNSCGTAATGMLEPLDIETPQQDGIPDSLLDQYPVPTNQYDDEDIRDPMSITCHDNPDPLCLKYGLDFTTQNPNKTNWLQNQTFFSRKCKQWCDALQKAGCPKIKQGLPHCICSNGCYGPNVAWEQPGMTKTKFLKQLDNQLYGKSK